MARINSRVVRRSACELNAYPNIDCTRLRYREEQLSPAGASAASKMARNASIPPDMLRQLRDKGRLPKPGEGPAAEKRAASSFVALCVAQAADGARGVCRISGGDPGYDETAKMVSEAALTIISTDRGALPAAERGGGGGVMTPAAALGEVYTARLERAGMRFENGAEVGRMPGEPDQAEEARALEMEMGVKDAW
jgi:short subunit dehydrogenase-like uncharacterized protein